MALLALEHGRLAYFADFALYGVASAALATYLLIAGPPDKRLAIAAITLIGLLGWSALEYALHRFVMHGLQPFSRWHAEHHQRPRALIHTPTLVSATLIVLLVMLPAWILGGRWLACALTLGALIGYLAYGITHHLIHHSRSDNAWLRRRRRWHAVHHRRPLWPTQAPAHYGVSNALWDHLLGTAHRGG